MPTFEIYLDYLNAKLCRLLAIYNNTARYHELNRLKTSIPSSDQEGFIDGAELQHRNNQIAGFDTRIGCKKYCKIRLSWIEQDILVNLSVE